MSGVTTHRMPDGTEIFYRDSDHAYWKGYDPETGKCSGRIPGISTIAKNDGDTSNDGLIDWGSKLSCEGVARELSLALSLDDVEDMRSALGWCESGESIWETLRAEKLTWRHIRDEAGTRGSLSHDVLQMLAEGKVPDLVSGYDRAVVRWWESRQPEPLMVEEVVYSKAHNFAGRFDLLATIDGELVLADLKTSKWASNSFAVQLNLYALAAREAGFITNPHRLSIVQAKEDGSYRELDVPLNPEWALAALQTYNHGKAIGAALRASKKAAEEQTLEEAASVLKEAA